MKIKKEHLKQLIKKQNEQDDMRNRIIISVSIACSSLAILFGIINLAVGKTIPALFEITGGIFMTSFTLFSLLARKKAAGPVIVITLLIMTICLYLFWNGGFGRTGIFWNLALPSLIFSLHSHRRALLLASLYLITIWGLFLFSAGGYIRVAYNGLETFTTSMVFGLISYILFYFEYSRDRYKRELRKLEQLLPICSHCKKIQDESGNWQTVELFIHRHQDQISFSHGICPNCLKELYPSYVDEEGELRS